MNRIHFPAYRQPPIRLANDAAFQAVPAVSEHIEGISADRVASALVRRHCAGLSFRPDGAAALDYLIGRTAGKPPMEQAIQSLLNRCSGADALHLTTLCRVPVRRLAHCARNLEVTNFVLIRFLNQFADPTAGRYSNSKVDVASCALRTPDDSDSHSAVKRRV